MENRTRQSVSGNSVAVSREYPGDLVLMDLQMPNLDGYGALQCLKAKGYQTPVLALTAHALKEDREKSLQLGFKEHLTKPINKTQLLETIGSFVEPKL